MQKAVTTKQFTEAECLALVERSPAAVASHDKAAWLDLFAAYSLVEDPVGAAPHVVGIYDARSGHRSKDRLARFYETFIAPNVIRFHVDRDTVCGLHVVRDLTIEIAMSEQVIVQVPVHLLYELTVEKGVLKVFRLAAHWELRPMLQQQMAAGWAFLSVGTPLAVRMLRYQGVVGTAGFMRALSSVGAAGKAQIARFVDYFNAHDEGALQNLFGARDIEIGFPYAAKQQTIAACVALGGTLQVSKVLAAGNVVSATVAYREAGVCHQGVAVFELAKRSLRIVAANFYWSSP